MTAQADLVVQFAKTLTRAENAERERDAAAYGLTAKVEDERRLIALLEQVKSERDEARREAVEIAALAQDGDDEFANLRRVAVDYGWSYLYKDADDGS